MSNPQDPPFAVIEFRAWTGKQMVYQDNQYLASFIRRVVLQINLEHGMRAVDHESYLPNGTVIDEYLQQYIRVQDKTGKKAYIGDIVRLDKAIGLHGEQIFEIIALGALGFSLQVEYGHEYDGINLQLVPFEIIGNVKEHPELLEVARVKTTLLSALSHQRHAVYRGPGGCYFVEDNTPVGNGYTVSYNVDPSIRIDYTEPAFDPATGLNLRHPFIEPSEENVNWCRKIEDLQIELEGYCDELAWEGVRVIKVEGGQQ